ncbi:MAG TPA: hypothetical protein PKC21_05095 [Oligoflexia bacterium]|nr:hypothetical protein [Oligoflexia bacterium]HMR24712.1 hypothetical protein [Oligoflexia bacterium]
MSINPKLEVYLTQLDKALGPISVSEKAEIISEIKSHVLDTQEKNPEKSMSSILQSFGEPEAVATRYLTERGLKPATPAKRQAVKWLTIGFLGTVAMVLMFVLVLVWKFTPLIKVDEVDGREKVELLGGMLKINVDEDTFSFDGEDVDFKFNLSSDDDYRWVKDAKEVDGQKFKQLHIKFNNGMMELSNHDQSQLAWKCKLRGNDIGDVVQEQGDILLIDFKNLDKAKCSIRMPQDLKLKVEGKNGKIELIEPKQDADLALHNGKCEIDPEHGVKYHYDLQVNHGKMDDFVSSSSSDAVQIKVRVKNGVISK